ncbi:hypothetical protein THOM_0965 [Trachipleistophora hominis]|uniref:Uncharacterized protein n=1 Tax=Trachipleistophora hominis TaxID=72359 RepID=L7JXK6_TRAHO|nr:hypothetical protein THOM_0965 [Trachipleistophora hominis]
MNQSDLSSNMSQGIICVMVEQMLSFLTLTKLTEQKMCMLIRKECENVLDEQKRIVYEGEKFLKCVKEIQETHNYTISTELVKMLSITIEQMYFIEQSLVLFAKPLQKFLQGHSSVY